MSCALIACLPPIGIVVIFINAFGERHGETIGYMVAACLLTCFLSLPCGYVAFKGVGPPRDEEFWDGCISQIIYGLGSIVGGILLSWICSLIAFIAGIGILFTGLAAVGVVNLILGTLSLLSNRSLIQEMSEIDLSFGKKPDATTSTGDE
ncbi:MAG: hypothetical protein AAF394_08675 [Planctomycetota bacterium]